MSNTAPPAGRAVLIMGAAGRDFHTFNVLYRDDPTSRVVAFTAAQIPGIDGRRYPPALAGPHYPDGIPIRPEDDLARIVREERVDEVVFAYSDLSHEEVMHRASIALAAGADFRLVGPRASMLASSKPVVAVCAVRTGCGKSQVARAVARVLSGHHLRVAMVRHPMPYGRLETMRVQRFATLDDIDAAHPTVEEREEYEAPVAAGMVMYAGVDYEEILRRAEAEADVIVWDGGNNDFPFFRPDLLITVADALRAGHELRYHPGEVNFRMADVIVVNKVATAEPHEVEHVIANAREVSPGATIIEADSPVTLEPTRSLSGVRVLVIEDGPTITHGGMPFGAGTVAARQHGATQLVDPRPYAVGSIRETYERFPHIGPVLPAMGYSAEQLADLIATVNASPCDVVVVGSPFDLSRLAGDLRPPVLRVSYELEEVGAPTLRDVLDPLAARWAERKRTNAAR